MNKPHHPWREPKRFAAAFVAGCFALQSGIPVYAGTVSQLPGIVVTPPDVNVMFTLDDSGSMESDVLPDLTKTGLGLPNDGNSRFHVSSYQYPDMWGTNSLWLTATWYASTTAGARFFRSSAGNPLYYNPANLYQPWPTAANDKILSANATPGTVTGTGAAAVYVGGVNIDTSNPFVSNNNSVLNLRRRINTTGTAVEADNETKNFWPATYYVYLGATALPAGDSSSTLNTAANFTKVEIKPSVSTYPHFLDATTTPPTDKRTDCVGAGSSSPSATATTTSYCSYEAELQNFANWLQYYHNRRMMAKGGIAKAFAQQGTNLRVGLATINSTLSNTTTAGGVVRKGIAQFNGTYRSEFYTELYPLANQSSIQTPLKKALDGVGQYFRRTGVGNPWAEDPRNAATVGTEYTCRKSFHFLSTDGYWTAGSSYDASTAGAKLNNDAFSGNTPPRPDGTFETYSATNAKFGLYPYSDTYANTLADVAAYYWATDLRTDLANKVNTSPRDPAYWQHLSTYTIGLGVQPSGLATKTTGGSATDLTAATPALLQAKLDALVTNKTRFNWTDPSDTDPKKIDDLIHASINGRGRYFLANDPATLAEQLSVALGEAGNQAGGLAALASSSQSYTTGGSVFQATYNPDKWTGKFYAFAQQATGVTNTTTSGAIWEASAQMPAFGARNIFSYNPSATGTKGSLFTWGTGGLNTAQKALLGGDSTRLDYLRGDATNEQQNGGTFRDRNHATGGGVLGDIVNGSPVTPSPSGVGYDRLPAGTPGREAYATYRSGSTSPLATSFQTVYVGANDGMMHAFNRQTGVERFAYVPNSVFSVPTTAVPLGEPRLTMLSAPAYVHRFTVDGPPQLADAYIGANAADLQWRNVLIESTGAGARSVFAIDVTDPAVSTTGMGTSKVLWEYSQADNTGMGYVMSYPHIAMMKNGKWAAIFGNGYDSATGQAKLIILDLQTGALIKEIPLGAADLVNKNGLSQPNFVLRDRMVTTIYAGDLKGNLWKVNVDDANPTNWAAAFGSTTPLYNTGTNKPITVMPTITFHPNGGVLLAFGTGKLFEEEDMLTTTVNVNRAQQQTMYGIWDKPSETTGFSGTTLLVQQAGATLTAAADSRLSGTTQNAVDWATKRGWYMNLTASSSGERVNVNPAVSGKDFRTLLITANTPDSNPCETGGTARIFVLDALTGAAPNWGVFDADRSGVINAADKGYNVWSLTSGVMSQPLIQYQGATSGEGGTSPKFDDGKSGTLAGGREDSAGGGNSGPCNVNITAGLSSTAAEGMNASLCPSTKGRISWRQIK